MLTLQVDDVFRVKADVACAVCLIDEPAVMAAAVPVAGVGALCVTCHVDMVDGVSDEEE